MESPVKHGESAAAAAETGCCEFAGYRLDPAKRRLTLHGRPVEITGKPFDLLVLLVQRAGQVISRRELADALWPATIVEDNNLSQAVLALRRALDDVHDVPRFIATVPRRGYQFIGEARRMPAAAGTRTSHRPAVVAAAVLIAAAAAGSTAWFTRPAPSAESAACAASRSLEASSLCRQALDLYATHGGIGVSVPGEPRAQILQRLDQAIELDPDFPEALGWRAHFLVDAMMFEPLPADGWQNVRAERVMRAERDAARALRLDPRQQMAQVSLARLDMYHWRLGAARARLDDARRQHPQSAMVEHYTAMVATLLGDFARAQRAAEHALQLDPRSPAPYSPLVLALLGQHEPERALAAARGMIERAPNAPIGYINLARALSAGSDPEALLEATRLAEQRIAGPTPNFRLDAALLYARAGDMDAARRLVGEFTAASAGTHGDAAIQALASLALRDYAAARGQVLQALAARGSGADPMPLFLIRENSWHDPELERQEWRQLRAQLEHQEREHQQPPRP